MGKCRTVAAYAAELRGIEKTLQTEVVEPIERDFPPSSWRGRLLAITGITRYLEPAQAILVDHGFILDEMETCTPPGTGDDDPDDDDNNDDPDEDEDDPEEPLPGVPGLDEIKVVFPGTRNVLSWGIVPTRFKRIWTMGDRVFATWRKLGTRDWPFFQVGDEPEALGTIWLVWKTRGRFIAAPSERLRRKRERTLTEFGFSHITDDGHEVPGDGDLVGVFISGPARHIGRSKRKYEHRGPIEWFVWNSNGELERFVGVA